MDDPPVIIKHEMFDYKELIEYFNIRYNKRIKTVSLRKNSKRNVAEDTPVLGVVPQHYLYNNNSGKGSSNVSFLHFLKLVNTKKRFAFKWLHCCNTLIIGL